MSRIEPTFDMRDTELMSDSDHAVPTPPASPPASDNRELYDLAIGHRSRAYYLARFRVFDADGTTSLAWHWPSFFFTFWWLLYRKMWRQAAIYLGASCLIAGATYAAACVSPSVAALSYGTYLIGVFFIPALIANSVYYWHCQKLIAEVCAISQDPQEQLSAMIAKGGTAIAVVVRTLVLAGFVVALLVAALATPIQEAYTFKARVKVES